MLEAVEGHGLVGKRRHTLREAFYVLRLLKAGQLCNHVSPPVSAFNMAEPRVQLTKRKLVETGSSLLGKGAST